MKKILIGSKLLCTVLLVNGSFINLIIVDRLLNEEFYDSILMYSIPTHKRSAKLYFFIKHIKL